jgi:hypothetical protein
MIFSFLQILSLSSHKLTFSSIQILYYNASKTILYVSSRREYNNRGLL